MSKELKKPEQTQIREVPKEEAEAMVRQVSKRFAWLYSYMILTDEQLVNRFGTFNENKMPPFTTKSNLNSVIGDKIPYVPYNQAEKRVCDNLQSLIIQRYKNAIRNTPTEGMSKEKAKYINGRYLVDKLTTR